MKITDLHPTVREALALHESFRWLSFIPDDIYVRPTVDKLFVVVRRGGKEFNAEAGALDMPINTFVTKWREAADWWNGEALEREREEIFRGSKVHAASVSFVTALLDHGFNIKRSDA